MKTNVSLEEARQLLLEAAVPVEECVAALTDALGRVLSKDIHASANLPPFNKSPLDGYALRAKDTEKAEPSSSVLLRVIEEVRAGYMPCEKITAGTSVKVMTGAPIPDGADAVIRFEDVKREGDLVRLYHPVKAGSNIIPSGEDVEKGETIARKGMVINPPLLGLLAAAGVNEVPVFRKVKIAIFSTGDELMEPEAKLTPGKIYDSNLHSLIASCAKLGAEPIPMGIVPDEKPAIAERLAQALEQTDLVITTGGVSVGDYDIVPDAIREIGADNIFHKIDMKPGSPMIAAKYKNKLIAGLSGNPAAAFISFDLIVVPLIKKMAGFDKKLPSKISAILSDNFNKPSNQRRFLRAKLYADKGKVFVKLTGNQSNGVLKSIVDCDALIDIPAGSGPLSAGQEVSVVILE